MPGVFRHIVPFIPLLVYSLRYEKSHSLPRWIPSLSWKPDRSITGNGGCSVDSSLGFSSNQHCYLLGGKSPDDADFFTDWTLDYTALTVSNYLAHKNVLGYLLNKILGKLKGYTHAIRLAFIGSSKTRISIRSNPSNL